MKLSIAILLGATLCHASNTTHITPRDSDTLTSCLQSASSSVIFQTSSASYTTARNGQANLDAMGSADPLAFVFPSTVQEVSAIVKCAVKFSTPITARSGGHSYEAYSINDKGVVVDLTSFVDVRIDTVAETVVVGGGNWLGRVYYLLQQAGGYVLPGGDCPHVGIGGHALGGGFGLLSRKLGLVIDQVLEVQLVDATGDIRTVNAKTDADLFWALRGAGGGNFGIVTSFTLKIHKAPPTLGLVQIVWSNPSDRARIIKAFTSITPTLPNEISSSLYTTGFGATSFIAGRYGPNAGFLDEILKPLFLNALPQTYTVVINQDVDGYVGMIQKIWEIQDASTLLDKSKLLSNSRFKGTSLLSNSPLTDDAIANLVSKGPLVTRANLQWDVSLMLDAWGGKIADVDANAMAFLHRGKSQIGLQLYTKWEESDAATAVDRKSMVQTWRESMTPFVLPTAYQNYIDSTLPLESYYGVDGLKKLKEVKTRMDPYNLWKFAQGIPTAVKSPNSENDPESKDPKDQPPVVATPPKSSSSISFRTSFLTYGVIHPFYVYLYAVLYHNL